MTENVETPGKTADDLEQSGGIGGDFTVQVEEEISSLEMDRVESFTLDTECSDLLSASDIEDIRSASSRSRRFLSSLISSRLFFKQRSVVRGNSG